MDWTMDKAIHEFISLSKQVFSKRKWLKPPILHHASQLMYSHRYKTDLVEAALQSAFGQGLLFGFNGSAKSDRVMVGVVAGVDGGRHLFLFTDYSRDSRGSGK
jgi:hypothetical protein